jgi:hypothetical protein
MHFAEMLSTGRKVKSVVCESDAALRDQANFLCTLQSTLAMFGAILV